MKKLVSIVLALTLVLSFSLSAHAITTSEKMSSRYRINRGNTKATVVNLDLGGSFINWTIPAGLDLSEESPTAKGTVSVVGDWKTDYGTDWVISCPKESITFISTGIENVVDEESDETSDIYATVSFKPLEINWNTSEESLSSEVELSIDFASIPKHLSGIYSAELVFVLASENAQAEELIRDTDMATE